MEGNRIQREKANVKRWVLSLDLNWGKSSVLRMSGGSEFQSLGAEQLKALLPMVLRRAGGTVR